MAKRLITLTVNGEPYQVAVEPWWTLLYTVREALDLIGSKEGCGTGDCGACSMIVDGRLVTSCIMLAVEADGSQVTTIEGLARDGQLHPLQKAFVERGAVQCGYCIPGMVMAAKAAGLAAVDAPYGDFRDPQGLARSCAMSRALGYDGKWAIHPDQLEVINQVFTPSDEDVARSMRIVEAYEAARARGEGSVAVDGKMVDAASVRLAQVTVAVANAARRSARTDAPAAQPPPKA